MQQLAIPQDIDSIVSPSSIKSKGILAGKSHLLILVELRFKMLTKQYIS